MKDYPYQVLCRPKAHLTGDRSRFLMLRGRIQHFHSIFLILVFLCSLSAVAQPAPSTNSSPQPLETWSFQDTTNWTDDNGDLPLSFTNLTWTNYGAGKALVVDSTNQAWLQFFVSFKGDTNLAVNEGSVLFWFGGNWSSVSAGGTGPGSPYGAMLETGSYTVDASVGWWSIYVDSNGDNLYFSAQTNSGLQTNYLSFPIAWTNGQFHLIAITYTLTNTQLYIDGTNSTNGPGITIYPNDTILDNGFWIGSASNGIAQCHGAISGLGTYSYPLDSNTISGTFITTSLFYGAEPQGIAQGSYTPSDESQYDVVTGPGYLLLISSNLGYPTSINVWLTNSSAIVTNGAVNLTFSIAGGSNGWPYDIFATTALTHPITNGIWSWMGQGYANCQYTIPGLTNNPVFLVLGTPQDSEDCGLTDAYQRLVTKTDPFDPFTVGGIPNGWCVLEGLNPADPNIATEDPDQDGLSNLQEYLYGTRPSVSEGMTITPAGATGTSPMP